VVFVGILLEKSAE
jgi:hypothetical protein